MAELDVPGARLWYEDSGGPGYPVVFVHPGSSTSQCWINQIQAFADAGFRCVVYDLRGRRKSKVLRGMIDAGHQIDDLNSLIIHLGFDRFALVSAAGGGYTAVDFALTFPERLVALVISGSHAGLDHDTEYAALKRRVVPKEMDGLPIHIREVGPAYRAENPEGLARWIAMTEESGRAGAIRQTLRNKITLDVLTNIKVPTLVVAGGADLLTPPPMMRLVASKLSDCQFVVMPDVGHSAHWENPEDWNRIVIRFLKDRAPR